MKKVCLIGAGAIGGYFIWGFDQMYPLCVIATGKRKEKLEKGICINDSLYFPKIKTPKEAGIQDIIFIATKYNGLDEAISYLPDLVGKNTIILSLLNGVTSEEKIKDHFIYSLMRIASRRIDDKIYFDEKEARGLYLEPNEIVESVLKQTKVSYHPEDNIYEDMWIKYAANIANNLPQALLQVPAALYTDSNHGYFIADMLHQEVRKIAKCKGVILQEKPYIFDGVKKSAKYSTLQDIESKRHTEIDMFLGELIHMGDELNIDLPYSKCIYHLIKALEEKNDGLFDFE